MAGAFRTVEALRVVLSEARDHAMEEVVRDMERARMTAEDYAQGNARAPDGGAWRDTERRMKYYRRGFSEFRDVIEDIAVIVDSDLDDSAAMGAITSALENVAVPEEPGPAP